MTIVGTRPEVIKVAPVVLELRRRGISETVCVTGQQRQMLDQMLELFGIVPSHDLAIMAERQSLDHISERALAGLGRIIDQQTPDIILVQGDTTTAFIAALVAFYRKIPVGHIEAGLRTGDKYNPFPEEMNRRLITQLADYHFAPTEGAAANLEQSGVEPNRIFITGNTVIDALLEITRKPIAFKDTRLETIANSDLVLVTTHRRENVGKGMEGIFNAVDRLARKHPHVQFVFPVHLNPAIREHAAQALGNTQNVLLAEPLEYSDLAQLLKKARLVMTDSGGIQEEAPTFGVPVLVLRSTTERPEGIEAGVAKLVGANADSIVEAADELLSSPEAHQHMARRSNPYGDGKAAEKIVDVLMETQK